MIISKENAIFYQNRFNYYIGDIIIKETLYIEDDYIVIGNIETSNNIVAKGNLIVIGDIIASSLYAFKDVFCRGKMSIDIEEIEGKLNKIEFYNCNINNKKIDEIKENTINIKEYEIDYFDKVNNQIIDNTNNFTGKTKSKRIYDIKDIQIGDHVKHNTLGEGNILSINNFKIGVDFISKGKRYISTDITLKLGLLKKYILDDNKTSLENSWTSALKSKHRQVQEKKVVQKEDIVDLNKEEVYLKKVCRNKPITFYCKYINQYILEVEGDHLKKYIVHYIKFNDTSYIRLNHICEILDCTTNIVEKFIIDDNIKVNYKDRCINGIKFITIEDLKRIINSFNIINDKICILESICLNIEKDCDLNLKNAIPYWSEVIDNILISKNMNIDELSKEWNVNVTQMKIVKNGYSPRVTKLKECIKENEIKNTLDDIHSIREVRDIFYIEYNKILDAHVLKEKELENKNHTNIIKK